MVLLNIIIKNNSPCTNCYNLVLVFTSMVERIESMITELLAYFCWKKRSNWVFAGFSGDVKRSRAVYPDARTAWIVYDNIYCWRLAKGTESDVWSLTLLIIIIQLGFGIARCPLTWSNVNFLEFCAYIWALVLHPCLVCLESHPDRCTGNNQGHKYTGRCNTNQSFVVVFLLKCGVSC